MLELSNLGATAFRNNTGVGWVGTGAPLRITRPMNVLLQPGDVVLRGPVRPLHAGLVKGSSDIIGWMSRTITPDIVGMTIAQFTAVECKNKNGRLTQEQRTFLDNVEAAGGIAGEARSPEDAREILRRHGFSP